MTTSCANAGARLLRCRQIDFLHHRRIRGIPQAPIALLVAVVMLAQGLSSL